MKRSCDQHYGPCQLATQPTCWCLGWHFQGRPIPGSEAPGGEANSYTESTRWKARTGLPFCTASSAGGGGPAAWLQLLNGAPRPQEQPNLLQLSWPCSTCPRHACLPCFPPHLSPATHNFPLRHIERGARVCPRLATT